MHDEPLGKPVSIRGLNKSYGDVEVLHGIFMEIKAGEFCTLLGASGSGKTTILKIIAGFEDFIEGEIDVGGRDIGSVPVSKRNIGMVFQNYALFPHMTVRRNVAFGLEMRKLKVSDVKRKVDDVLRLVGLEELGERMPGDLSGGQQQRVALARALVINPDILLMDEPLGALDKNLRHSIQLQLKNLHRELGITIIYVTHDQEEALNLSDKIAIMDKGRIVQHGTPQELYFKPVNAFVAGFLGECNFLIDNDGKPFAVRPENIKLDMEGTGEGHRIDATIQNVVFLGAGNKIIARSGERQIVANVGNDAAVSSLVSGQPIRFSVDATDIVDIGSF